MSAITTPIVPTSADWSLPYKGKVGMASLIIAESAILRVIFVVAYLFYVGKSLTGPTPRAVLETPVFYYHLPAVQQRHGAPGGPHPGARPARRVPGFVARSRFVSGTLAGSVGWFREVLPHEHEERVPVLREDISITTSRSRVERFPLAEEQARAWLPVETYPASAGLKGGLAGSVAMAVIACAYGLISVGSIWYPINLLGGTVASTVGVAFGGAAKLVSRRSVFHRRNPAYHRLVLVGLPRRHAAHDRAPPHSVRRPDRSGPVVRPARTPC